MTSAATFVTTVISSAGVSAALLAAAAWLLRTWIRDRLSASIKHVYDQRLAELNASLKQEGDAAAARLKADMDRLAERLRYSALSFSEVQKATIERRLMAIEQTWRAVLVVKEAIPACFVYLDILTDEECLDALQNPKIGPQLKSIDHYAIIESTHKANKGLEASRPFIGSYLWALYFTYQATLFRMIYLVSQCGKEPKKIFWYSDQLARRHIQAGLGEDRLKDFDDLKHSRVSWVREQFTREILNSMESVIAGRESGAAAMRQAEQMEALLREAATERA